MLFFFLNVMQVDQSFQIIFEKSFPLKLFQNLLSSIFAAITISKSLINYIIHRKHHTVNKYLKICINILLVQLDEIIR